MKEILLLVRQGEQGWLLTGGQGNHEFARAYYIVAPGETEPRYIIRDGKARVGAGIDLVNIAVGPTGATLSWSCGRKSHLPQDYFQYSWR